MSDYGDEYSDYGDEWLYVEEEYVGADDLAEHAVPSPPPTTYEDDALLDWDRFDYYNDLEYASDGYDDASFEQNNGAGAAKIGQKRKRNADQVRERKRRRIGDHHPTTRVNSEMLSNSPVVWRSRANRGLKPKMITEDVESYAVLKDWRAMTGDSPTWAQQTSQAATPRSASPKASEARTASVHSPGSPASEAERDEEQLEGEENGVGLDPAVLMAVLQERIAAAGGPLSGMDPQQLLQFAMRMANGNDAGDDIAGEMADEMLGMKDDEEDGDDEEEAEQQLLSWVAQQRAGSGNQTLGEDSSTVASTPPSSNKGGQRRPPTPPSSQANRSVCAPDDVGGPPEKRTKKANEPAGNTLQVEQVSRKRKTADTTEADTSSITTKRRATKSYDAPTASSKAKTTATRSTRGGRIKR